MPDRDGLARACSIISEPPHAGLSMNEGPGFFEILMQNDQSLGRYVLSGRELSFHPLTACGPDGAQVQIQSWNSGGGPDSLLFIHGYAQSHRAWLKQVASPDLSDLSIATYDLRGHGSSAKPRSATAYRDSSLWADELAAVIEALGFERPIVVAWSYAGRVVLDYVKHHGTKGIGGLVMVAATCSGRPECRGRSASLLAAMGTARTERDMLGASADFLTACTYHPIPQDESAFMLDYNMMVPPHVRSALSGRDADYDDVLRRLDLPTLAIHGRDDRINDLAMSKHFAANVSGAAMSLYENCGHLPFWEQHERFNRDLAAFVRSRRR